MFCVCSFFEVWGYKCDFINVCGLVFVVFGIYVNFDDGICSFLLLCYEELFFLWFWFIVFVELLRILYVFFEIVIYLLKNVLYFL